MASKDTRQRILDSAEALFAEQGFSATSLRDITSQAGANLAAVSYHFGSRDELILALFERRLTPMNAERMTRLADWQQAGDGDLRQLVRAYVGPALEMSHDPGGARFIRLLGRSFMEPWETLHEHVRGLYDEVISAFKPAFESALPQLPPDELYWRMHFMLGVLAYCMAGTDVMRLIASCGRCDPLDTEALIDRLTHFVSAGMEADMG